MVAMKTKKDKRKNIIVICVEGDADELIFRHLLEYYQKEGWCCPGELKYHNANGFPSESEIRSKLNQIQRIYSNKTLFFHTVLCEYDTDVFEDGACHLPDWSKVRKSLERDFPYVNFCQIEVKTSIEDWMLDDLDGLLKALKLPMGTRPKGRTGQDKVKALFRKKNIVYDRHKGKTRIKPIIDKLDIAKIREARKKELREFEKLLGVTID